MLRLPCSRTQKGVVKERHNNYLQLSPEDFVVSKKKMLPNSSLVFFKKSFSGFLLAKDQKSTSISSIYTVL